MKPWVTTKGSNIAILGIPNYYRFIEELQGPSTFTSELAIGWHVQKYDHFSLPYRELKPEVYRSEHLEVPRPLLPRLAKVANELDWDKESWNLFQDQLLKQESVAKIKNMDMDFIRFTLDQNGINPSELKRSLRDHQLQALAMYIICGSACNFGQMRTGKTPPTIDYGWWLYCNKKIDAVLVVTMSKVKYTWYNELAEDLPEWIHSFATVIDGIKSARVAQWNSHQIFYIANYEGIRVDIEIIQQAFENKRFLLVLDECHKVKNNESKNTQTIKQLNPEYTVILSGSPVANKPEDVFEPTNLIAEDLLGFSFNHFKRSWAYTNSYQSVTTYRKGALDEIHKRLALISVRALRKDVNLEVGQKIEPQLLESSKDFMDLYNKATDQFVMELNTPGEKSKLFISSFLARLVRLQQLTDGYLPKINPVSGVIERYIWLDQEMSMPNIKIAAIDEWIEDYLYDVGKLVIFSRFVPVLQRLYARYKQHGARLIYGETDGKMSDLYQQEFSTKDDVRILICNTSCAEGKDFNPCNFVFFFDRVWGLKDNTQAEDRVTGMRQTKESTIMPLCIKGTIDKNLEFEVLPKKRRDAAAVEDGVDNVSFGYTMDDLFSLLK